MISTFETIRLFGKHKFNQCLADIIFMVDFLFPGEPVILNKDGTLFVVFEIEGIDHEWMEPAEVEDIEKEIRVFSELIKKEDVFVLFNLLFMAGGIISIVSFLYDGINAVSITGGIVTLIIGFAIFTMIKKYGVKIEEKTEKEEKEK